VVVARELTKLHEEVWRGSAREAAARAAAGGEPRGEHVIVVAGATAPPDGSTGDPGAEALEARVRAELEAGASVRDAARTASAELGVARRTAYDAALRAAAGTAPGAAERDGA